MPPALFYVFHNLIPFMELRYLYRWGFQNGRGKGSKMEAFLQGFGRFQNERVSK
jgi:hypothetical protein